MRGAVTATRRCNLEAGEYDTKRGEAPLTLRALKVRDGERPAPLHLIRRRVELAEMDQHGQPVTSCVIERDRRTREDREAETRAATARAHRAADVLVLRTLRDHAVTSKESLRAHVVLRRDDATEALARILAAGWAEPPLRQRLPYTVTATGLAALQEVP